MCGGGLYLDTISEIIAPLGLSGPPRVGDMQQAAAGAAPAATVVQMEEVEMEIVAKEVEMAQVEVVAATQTWSQWLLYGPVDLSFFVPMFGSRGARIFYAAFPWTAPISFAVCMAVTVDQYGRVAAFGEPCNLGNYTNQAGWLPPLCELPVLEISTYAAVPGYSWDESSGARSAFFVATLFVALHAVLICPARVALLEHHVQQSSDAGHAPRRCCFGACCPSHVAALWLFRLHLAFMLYCMSCFVALPFYRCCEADNATHTVLASQVVQWLLNSLICDVLACTQLLRAGVQPSIRRGLFLSTMWGGFCILAGAAWSLVWTAKQWWCVEDGYSRSVCTFVFVGEWLLVFSLLVFYVPMSWLVHRLAKAQRL